MPVELAGWESAMGLTGVTDVAEITRRSISIVDFSQAKGPLRLHSNTGAGEFFFFSWPCEGWDDWDICPVVLTKVYLMQSGILICNCFNPHSSVFTRPQPTTYQRYNNTCWLRQRTCVGKFFWPTFCYYFPLILSLHHNYFTPCKDSLSR